MADIQIALYKEKEFDRVRNFVLNQLSILEADLNIDGLHSIIVPSEKDIKILSETLMELRSNILTAEERRLLNEDRRRETKIVTNL